MNESELKSEAAPVAGNGSVDGTRTDYRRIVDSVPGSILVADAVVESSVGEDSARPSSRLGISGKGLQGRAGSLRHVVDKVMTQTACPDWRRGS
jgi:hypothetical protein